MRDPLGRARRADIVGEFAPMGVGLRLETDDPAILDACQMSFGRYDRRPAGEPADFLTLRFFVDPEFDESPPWPGPVFRGHGDVFYISVGRQNTAVADLARGTAVAFVSPSMARDHATLRRSFLDCLVLTMLTHGSKGCFSYVHASAVEYGGRGILFSGPSESGKSTMAYACARRGFRVVSDDVVYLRNEGNELAAWGRPWRLRLMPGALELFPELAAKRPEMHTTGDPELLELEVESLLPGRISARCIPAVVLFLDRSKEAPSSVPISEERALELLGRDLMYDEPAIVERHRTNWRRLARNGAWILRGAWQPDDAVDLVKSHLASMKSVEPPTPRRPQSRV
jgi:hypothetical protein